jgi:hypothetical protein
VNWGAPGATCDGAFNRCSQGFCPNVASGTTPSVCPTIVSDGQACDVNGQTGQCSYGSACVPGIPGEPMGTCGLGFAVCM